jgi:glycosyltransferase involved in cell wall biosynthesis
VSTASAVSSFNTPSDTVDSRKVLLIGHTCSPGRGSEEGTAWNWARSLARHHQVWILSHPRTRPAVDAYLAANPCSNLRFVWVEVPRWLDPWDPRTGERFVRLHYYIWLRFAFRVARKLHDSYNFDIVHHIGWGSVNAPPPFWRLNAPFVWGPIGGGQTVPRAFYSYFGKKWPIEYARAVRVQWLRRLRPLKDAVRHSTVIFTTNRETTAIVRSAGAERVIEYLDSGVAEEHVHSALPRKRPPRDVFTALWVGRLEIRKCLPLAIEAVARARTGVPVQLLIAGDGSQRAAWMQLAAAMGISDRVKFLGHVPWVDMADLFFGADAFLFTSLRDSFGSVILEAAAHGLPIITLDHQGAGTFLPNEAAIKVPVTTPVETVAALAHGLDRLAESPDLRERMGEAAWRFTQEHLWPRRALEMSQWYDRVVRSRARQDVCTTQ